MAWITHVLGVGNFLVQKMSSKHINMESSFKDLIVTSLTMKTVRKSDKRFDLQNTLNFQIFVFNMMISTLLSFSVLVLIKRLD
jgi:hypothetical protein